MEVKEYTQLARELFYRFRDNIEVISKQLEELKSDPKFGVSETRHLMAHNALLEWFNGVGDDSLEGYLMGLPAEDIPEPEITNIIPIGVPFKLESE